MGKVVSSVTELLAELEPARGRGRRIVFTNGCFDILHVGHVRLLEAARSQGDVLVIGVNSDDYVRQTKGEGRPIFPEAERKEILAALRSVDFVIGFSERTSANLIRQVKPDLFVKGGDYRASLPPEESQAAREVGATVVFLPLVPGHSSSQTFARMIDHDATRQVPPDADVRGGV